MRLTSSQHKHPYHLADASPWPLFCSIAILSLAIATVMSLHEFSSGGFFLKFSFLVVAFILGLWWRDIVRESTFLGEHTFLVQRGLRLGMFLFILSEVMFFFGFFWAFFHSALAPAVQIGGIWPPKGIVPLYPWGLPFLNTMLLLLSGAVITWSHFELRSGNFFVSFKTLLYTITLGLFFTFVQYYEYKHASFHIGDSVFGSIFYLATGFHGAHVLIGTTFLIVCLLRLALKHFTRTHHFGFEAAAWYWHFVDVVWLFLFVSIYWWGG